MKKDIENWLNELNISEFIPEEIIAINFGLFESDKGYILYMTGSEFYDMDDDDWASEIDYEPQKKYLTLGKSAEIDWEFLEDEVVKNITEILNSESFKNSMFSNVSNITVGFDDGDLVKIK